MKYSIKPKETYTEKEKLIPRTNNIPLIVKGQKGMQVPDGIKRPIIKPIMTLIPKPVIQQPKIEWATPLPKPEPIISTQQLADPDYQMLSKFKEKIPQYSQQLTDAGYSKEQSAGILGSLFQESNFNFGAKQQSGGPGFGLGQWTKGGTRYRALQNLAQSLGKPITDEGVQMQYLIKELNDPALAQYSWGRRDSRDKFLKGSTSVADSTANFTKLFLRPNPRYADIPRRIKFSGYISDILK